MCGDAHTERERWLLCVYVCVGGYMHIQHKEAVDCTFFGRGSKEGRELLHTHTHIYIPPPSQPVASSLTFRLRARLSLMRSLPMVCLAEAACWGFATRGTEDIFIYVVRSLVDAWSVLLCVLRECGWHN